MNNLKLEWQNWAHPTRANLVLITGIVASLTAFTPQFLAVLHEAPFPVSVNVDNWITWLLKMATVVLSLFSIFSKSPESNNIYTAAPNDAEIQNK
jgi:hypothetical protein